MLLDKDIIISLAVKPTVCSEMINSRYFKGSNILKTMSRKLSRFKQSIKVLIDKLSEILTGGISQACYMSLHRLSQCFIEHLALSQISFVTRIWKGLSSFSIVFNVHKFG
jgi:hypothetical protein